jgi:hypothetical protein
MGMAGYDPQISRVGKGHQRLAGEEASGVNKSCFERAGRPTGARSIIPPCNVPSHRRFHHPQPPSTWSPAPVPRLVPCRKA